MQRRHFILGTTTGLIAGPGAVRAAADDAADVRAAVEKVYHVYYQVRDKAQYRALLTDDYLLLEHGEIITLDADIAMMPAPGPALRRTDKFDFRSTQVAGETAHAVYFLSTDVVDAKGARHFDFLESSVMRRSGSGAPWRMALCHSTRLAKPPA